MQYASLIISTVFIQCQDKDARNELLVDLKLKIY